MTDAVLGLNSKDSALNVPTAECPSYLQQKRDWEWRCPTDSR